MSAKEVSSKQLGIYLNDHLAGSVAAVELIEHLSKKFPDSNLEALLEDLKEDIRTDQETLRDLLRTFGEKESAMRKAGAWLAEKLGRAKLGISENDMSGTGLLEGLEALVLGITGKGLLWRALSAASQWSPQLQGPDYAALEQRAVEQRNRVEEKRLMAAREAFRE